MEMILTGTDGAKSGVREQERKKRVTPQPADTKIREPSDNLKRRSEWFRKRSGDPTKRA